MNHPKRDRSNSRVSAISAGMRWASTITTIGLEMALPPLAGAWLDREYGTEPLWLLVFAVVGFAAAMMHLWQLLRRLQENNARSARKRGANDRGGD